MNIFDKRPLSLILCILLGGFIFFQSVGGVVLSVIAVLLVSLFLFSFLNPVEKIIKGWFGRIIIISTLISFFLSFLYFDAWFYAKDRFDDKEVTVRGVITDMQTENGTTEIDVVASSVNNLPSSSYKLKAYLDSDIYYNFSRGTEVKINGVIDDFNLGDGSFDTKKYYTSLGYSGVITDVSEVTIISNANFGIEVLASSYRSTLTRNIVLNTDREVGGLLSAILLGDKTYLSGQTALDFSRIGISHILALSGMHLAILILGIEKLLGVFGIRKRARYVITVFLTLFYMILTGLPVSVVRAGLMLIIRSLLHLFSKTHDSVTSLSLSVFIICLVEPYAVFSTSLWLSALATFGILVYSEYTATVDKKDGKLQKLKAALMISVFAIAATLLMTANTFSGISILGAFSTIIFSFLVEIFLYIGMFIPLVGAFVPLRLLVIPLGNFISSFAGALSDIDYVYSSTSFLACKILILLITITFIVFSVFKIKQKKRMVIILSSLITFLFIISPLLTYTSQNEERFIYESYGEEEIIKISADGEIGIIDVANYEENTSFTVTSSLSDDNLTRIDKYIMMRYSYNMSDAIINLCNRVKVEKIIIPRPVTYDENMIYESIASRLSGYRTELSTFSTEDMIYFGDLAVMPIYSGLLSVDTTEILFTIIYNDKCYTYTTLTMLEGKNRIRALEVINESETIIFASHGYGHDYDFNYKIKGIENIVFSSDRIFVHSSVREYYKDANLYFTPQKVDFIKEE